VRDKRKTKAKWGTIPSRDSTYILSFWCCRFPMAAAAAGRELGEHEKAAANDLEPSVSAECLDYFRVSEFSPGSGR
jgi:2-methylcitrate dehydratase PrpD